MDKLNTIFMATNKPALNYIILVTIVGILCALLSVLLALNLVAIIGAFLAIIIVLKVPELYLTIFLISILPVFHFLGVPEKVRHIGVYGGAVLVLIVFLCSLRGKLKLSISGITMNLCFPLLMLCLLCIGVFFSGAPNYGNQKVIGFTQFCLIPCFLFYLYFRNKSHRIVYLLLSIIIMGGIVSLGAIQQFATIGFSLGFRAEAYGINTIWNGRYASLGLIASWFLWRIIRKTTKKWDIVFVALIVCFTVALIGAGSRGPILALLGTVLIYYVFMHYIMGNVSNFRMLINRILGIVAILAFIYMLYFFLPLINPRFDLSYMQHHDVNTSVRIEMLVSSFKGWFESNIIAGSGTGSFAILWENSDIRCYPHNIFAELLYENGLFGLGLLIIYIIVAFKACKKLAYVSPDIAGFLICGLTLSLSNACVSGDITSLGNNWMWIFGAVAIGLVETYKLQYELEQI